MKHHCWGRYSPGAWRLTRVTTETLDARGKVVATTTTEELTKLVTVNPETVTLRVESTIEVGGKVFPGPAQFISQGLHGETLNRQFAARRVGEENTVIGGRQIRCNVYTYRVAEGDFEKEVKIYYSSDVQPHILRRETVTRGPDNETKYRTNVEVVDLSKTYHVVDRDVAAAEVKTVRQNGKGRIVTVAVHADEVPGNAVAYSTDELDANGRVIRRSKMELLDFGTTPPEDSPTFRNRRQYRRYLRRSGR